MSIKNQVKLVGIAPAAVVASIAFVSVALAQSGHFLDKTVSCTDIGTQLQCTGKVAGLGGTTFTVSVSAQGTASVECTNPGGNVAPGQDTSVTAAGSDTFPTPRNGQSRFTVTTNVPTVPNFPTCPNPGWTATVIDVTFPGEVTLNLFEDSISSDTITVPVTQP